MQVQDRQNIQAHEEQIRIQRALLTRLNNTIRKKQLTLSKTRYPQYPEGYYSRAEALQDVNNLLLRKQRAEQTLRYHIECIDRQLNINMWRKQASKQRAWQIREILQANNIHERGIHNLIQQYVGRY